MAFGKMHDLFELICLGLKEYKELKDQHPKIFQSIQR